MKDITFMASLLPIAWILQIGVFIYVVNQARALSNFFPKSFSRSSVNSLSFSDQCSSKFNEFAKDISAYLSKNQGTPDFNILQSKTERTLSRLYDNAASVAAFPTYIGLLFTFLGVGAGLGSFGGEGSIQEETNILALISGVSTAMWTSFSGLLVTIILQFWLSIVKNKASNRKNDFYNFLQNELLPHLNKDLSSTIASLREVIGGINSSFTTITDNLVSTFSGITQQFGDEFRSNVSSIHQAITAMGKNMGKINESTELQRNLLHEIGSDKFNRSITQMLTMANRFEEVSESNKQFASLQIQLNTGTESLIERQAQFIEELQTPRELVAGINKLLEEFHSFRENINHVGRGIEDSKMLGANLMQTIQRQLESITKRSEFIDEHIRASDEDTKQYIADQNKGFQKLVRNHLDSMEQTDESLRNEFAKSADQFSTSVKKHFEILSESVNPTAVFSKLSLLDNLTSLKKMDSLDGMSATQVELLDKMGKLDVVISEIQSLKVAIQNNKQKSGSYSVATEQRPSLTSPSGIRPWYKKLFSKTKKADGER